MAFIMPKNQKINCPNNVVLQNVDNSWTLPEKLLNYGINNVSEYVENGKWLSQRNYRKKEGFDIFKDVTNWPDKLLLSEEDRFINVINRNKSKFRTSLVTSNISTKMILKDRRKILWKHGQCLSFEPPKLVRLFLVLFSRFFHWLNFPWNKNRIFSFDSVFGI